MESSALWTSLLGLVSESGIWAMLFVALLIILIRNNNNREAKYQQIINKLSSSLKVVEEIKEDVEDLKFAANIGAGSRGQISDDECNCNIKTKGDNYTDDTKRKDENC